MKYAAALLTVIAALAVSTVSAPAAATHATGSCPPPTIAAVVNSTFVCLSIGGPCSARFGQDYATYHLTCTARGRLAKALSGSAANAGLADAFLNTRSNDFKTRLSTFKLTGPPPVLHLTFKRPLSGVHKVTVDVHNPKLDQTLDYTLQKGWQFTYEALPAASSNSTAGAYRITISIDGAMSKQLYYSVKP